MRFRESNGASQIGAESPVLLLFRIRFCLKERSSGTRPEYSKIRIFENSSFPAEFLSEIVEPSSVCEKVEEPEYGFGTDLHRFCVFVE